MYAFELVLEEILESPFGCKDIQPVHPKGNQPWIFIGGTDAEVKLQYFGHLMWRAVSLEKTVAGPDGRPVQRALVKWFDSITDSMGMNLSTLQAIVEDRGPE